ncbi:MAG: hypothetical protein JWO36_598 [Myxococcales bacterium]|nr:hypothetical protein [Myxococcales bacterium]
MPPLLAAFEVTAQILRAVGDQGEAEIAAADFASGYTPLTSPSRAMMNA